MKKRVALGKRKRYVNKALAEREAKRSLKTEQESTKRDVNSRKKLTEVSERVNQMESLILAQDKRWRRA